MAFQTIMGGGDPLSAETNVKIMKEVGMISMHYLHALITNCPALYATFDQNQGDILFHILINTLGDALLYGFALYAANRVDWKAKWPMPSYDELIQDVHYFGRKYLDRTKAHFAFGTHELSFSMVCEMVAFHQTVASHVSAYTHDAGMFHQEHLFAIRTADYNQDALSSELTSTEIARVQRGFYIVEITRVLFPFCIDDDENYGGEHGERYKKDGLWNALWHHFAPWDNLLAMDIARWMEEAIGYGMSS